MTDNAEVTMALYQNLTADEERMLKGFEHDVVSVLLRSAVNTRPIWTSRTDANDRFVQCVIGDPQPRVLLELSSSELATLSPNALCSRLEDNLRQR